MREYIDQKKLRFLEDFTQGTFSGIIKEHGEVKISLWAKFFSKATKKTQNGIDLGRCFDFISTNWNCFFQTWCYVRLSTVFIFQKA